MKRLCIYVIYDAQKRINSYIERVLRELSRFVTDIIVVCNFDKPVSGDEYVLSYAKKMFCRENIGMDAGAYKDAIVKYIPRDVLTGYDELILTNDTYFAPIIPFDDMFNSMDREPCDYWGITRHPEGCSDGLGSYEEHIQSFFFCFKSVVLHDKRFLEFWKTYRYTMDKNQTIIGFELGMNRFMNSLGYKGKAYMDLTITMDGIMRHDNPYLCSAYELIKDGRVPIIKKTNFYGRNRWYVNTLRAMKYIEENCEYDTSLIWDYVDEYQKKGLIGSYYDFDKMKAFVESHKRIFIYGNGAWGHITSDYFDYMGWEYDSIVVTKPVDEREVAFDDVHVEKEDGVIIAQDYERVCKEIVEYIGNRCEPGQIFTPCYV